MKEELIERQQEDFDKVLAEKLGITYDELLELEYEINDNESEDGLLYNHYIIFSSESNQEVLEKVRKKNNFNGDTYIVPVNFFDN